MPKKREIDKIVIGILASLLLVASPLVLWPSGDAERPTDQERKHALPVGEISEASLPDGLRELTLRLRPVDLPRSLRIEWQLPSGTEIVKGALHGTVDRLLPGQTHEWTITTRLPSPESHRIEVLMRSAEGTDPNARRVVHETKGQAPSRGIASQRGRTRSSVLPVSF
jgi:hypothetical protein